MKERERERKEISSPSESSNVSFFSLFPRQSREQNRTELEFVSSLPSSQTLFLVPLHPSASFSSSLSFTPLCAPRLLVSPLHLFCPRPHPHLLSFSKHLFPFPRFFLLMFTHPAPKSLLCLLLSSSFSFTLLSLPNLIVASVSRMTGSEKRRTKRKN